MRGPIIQEHVTNFGVAAGETSTYNIKSDGRVLRAFVKFQATSTGTIGYTVSVKPVAHFSDEKVVVSWPVDSAGTTNYLIQPNGGSVTGTSSGTVTLPFYILDDGVSSEYQIAVTADADTTITRLYVLTELV